VTEGAAVSGTGVWAAAAMFLTFRMVLQMSGVRDQGSVTLGDLDICIVRRRWVILRKLRGNFFGGLSGKQAEDGRRGEVVFWNLALAGIYRECPGCARVSISVMPMRYLSLPPKRSLDGAPT